MKATYYVIQDWMLDLDLDLTEVAILAIIKGSLARGLRYFSGYLENNDVVRVTGYLVKKSEIEKLRAKQQSLNNVTVFGMGAQDGGHALDRRVQRHEESAGQ